MLTNASVLVYTNTSLIEVNEVRHRNQFNNYDVLVLTLTPWSQKYLLHTCIWGRLKITERHMEKSTRSVGGLSKVEHSRIQSHNSSEQCHQRYADKPRYSKTATRIHIVKKIVMTFYRDKHK